MEIKAVNENEIIARIDKRVLQARNTKQLMNNVAVDMKNKARYRFIQEKDPGGKRWARNSEVTIKRKKSAKPGSDTGTLRDSITHKSSLYSAIAGTSVDYAPTMQYGAKKGQYSQFSSLKTKTGKVRYIPWGNIPARRFVGFSGNQKNTYKKWIKKHLKS